MKEYKTYLLGYILYKKINSEGKFIEVCLDNKLDIIPSHKSPYKFTLNKLKVLAKKLHKNNNNISDYVYMEHYYSTWDDDYVKKKGYTLVTTKDKSKKNIIDLI